MTQTELKRFEDLLLENGYRKWSHCKTELKTSREWMKTIDGVIISFRVWGRYDIGEPYNIDVCLVRSERDIRADLTITNPCTIEYPIGYIEGIAKQFKDLKL